MTLSLADLIDIAETFESRANFQRSLAKSRVARLRHEHQGKADGHDADARFIREIIAQRSPKPAPLLQLVRESADVA